MWMRRAGRCDARAGSSPPLGSCRRASAAWRAEPPPRRGRSAGSGGTTADEPQRRRLVCGLCRSGPGPRGDRGTDPHLYRPLAVTLSLMHYGSAIPGFRRSLGGRRRSGACRVGRGGPHSGTNRAAAATPELLGRIEGPLGPADRGKSPAGSLPAARAPVASTDVRGAPVLRERSLG